MSAKQDILIDQTLAVLSPADPPTLLAGFVAAHKTGDKLLATVYRRELERLGILVRFPRSHKKADNARQVTERFEAQAEIKATLPVDRTGHHGEATVIHANGIYTLGTLQELLGLRRDVFRETEERRRAIIAQLRTAAVRDRSHRRQPTRREQV
jgi:hypothetical protein